MRLDLVNLSRASESELDDLVNVITGFTTGNLDKKTFVEKLIHLQWYILRNIENREGI